jgi:hypothetical protein
LKILEESMKAFWTAEVLHDSLEDWLDPPSAQIVNYGHFTLILLSTVNRGTVESFGQNVYHPSEVLHDLQLQGGRYASKHSPLMLTLLAQDDLSLGGP